MIRISKALLIVCSLCACLPGTAQDAEIVGIDQTDREMVEQVRQAVTRFNAANAALREAQVDLTNVVRDAAQLGLLVGLDTGYYRRPDHSGPRATCWSYVTQENTWVDVLSLEDSRGANRRCDRMIVSITKKFTLFDINEQ